MEAVAFSPLELRFLEALGLIVLAAICVPLSKRLGLGTIVGYLAAGIAAGALLGSGLWGHPEDLLHFAEFGVVLFLFVVGLEFRPARLWAARATIFGRGTAQVLVCGALLAVPPLLVGLPWQAAIIIGLGLALSSTALVLQALDAEGARSSALGETAIAILLFEDLAIVPLLLLVTLLSAPGDGTGWADGLRALGLGVAAILLVIGLGRYALEPMLRILARARLPEIMTASALGLVIAASLLMDAVGLSYAMGAFLAGVMLAESSYRHEVEADIEPFRGLFLGLFFLAVGLSLDIGVIAANALLILAAVPLCVGLKALGIYAVSRAFRAGHRDAARLAAKLSQHGEFGFVLFAAAASDGLLDPGTASILVSIVSLSMAVSALVDRMGARLVGAPPRARLEEDFAGAGGPVLVVGFGRFGQTVAQPLLAEGIPVTLIDHDADRIHEARRFGCRVHFGDGTRRDVLRAAGADEARAIAVCTADPAVTDRIVTLLARDFDGARVLARAWDRVHALRLRQASVDAAVRETAASAFALAQAALTGLGYDPAEAAAAVAAVTRRDADLLDRQAEAARGALDRDGVLDRIVPTPLAPVRADARKGGPAPALAGRST